MSRGTSLELTSTPFTPIRICEETLFVRIVFHSKPSYTSSFPSFSLRLKITCFKASLDSFSELHSQPAHFVESATRNALAMFYLPHLSSTNWVGTAVGVTINMVWCCSPRFPTPFVSTILQGFFFVTFLINMCACLPVAPLISNYRFQLSSPHIRNITAILFELFSKSKKCQCTCVMLQQRQQQASNTCCMTSHYLSECIRNQRTSKVLDDPNAEHTNSHRDETFEKLRVSCLPPPSLHSSNRLVHFFSHVSQVLDVICVKTNEKTPMVTARLVRPST